MVFGLWVRVKSFLGPGMTFSPQESALPATPVPAHLKQQPGLHAAVRSLLSTPQSPDSPASSVASTSSCEWDSDDCTPTSTPGTTPASSPRTQRIRKVSPRSSPTKSLPDHLALDLVFSGTPSSSGQAEADDSCSPPAFFPCSRIAFSPKLKITYSKGLKLNGSLISSASARLAAVTREQIQAGEEERDDEEQLCGMALSVAGVVEILGTSKNSSAPVVKSTRLIADFCTDLSSGIKIWQRDAHTVKKRSKTPRDPGRLPAGTYVLPLSMKIPASDQLPPSFECPYFRLRYTMTLALFSKRSMKQSKPRILKLVHMPFQILPSTMPSVAPELPILTHASSYSFGSVAVNLFSKLVGSDSTSREEPTEWQVQTCLPTSSFSPSEIVPITLNITSPVSAEPTSTLQQIFIRLTLVRRIYVRESSQSAEQEFDWGLGLDALAHDEMAWERYLREETELCQKWGVLTLPAFSPVQSSQSTLKNIPLPLKSLLGHEAGYSTFLDLTPGSGRPSLDCTSSSSSWFAPAIISATNAANSKAWDKHLHVSSRFYVAVEIGFFAASPRAASSSSFEVHSSPSPFAPRQSCAAAPTTTKPHFPGKLRELLVPITVGSVAEPALSCFAENSTSLAEWAGEARGSTQPGEDQGEPIADCWVLPPPSYEDHHRSPVVSSL